MSEEFTTLEELLKKPIDDRVGVTERGDPALDHNWMSWVKKGNAAIIITKNCAAVRKLLSEIANPNVIVHCGITGWGGSVIEPNIPAPEKTLDAYKQLSDELGSERVVLRIDPIITSEIGLEKAIYVFSHRIGRVRISFIDAYPHVRRRFEEVGIALHEGFHAPENVRRAIWESLDKPETCAEPGLPSAGCVGAEDCRILGIKPREFGKGQRPLCPCLGNKFELLTEKKQCGHGCLYCYWYQPTKPELPVDK